MTAQERDALIDATHQSVEKAFLGDSANIKGGLAIPFGKYTLRLREYKKSDGRHDRFRLYVDGFHNPVCVKRSEIKSKLGDVIQGNVCNEDESDEDDADGVEDDNEGGGGGTGGEVGGEVGGEAGDGAGEDGDTEVEHEEDCVITPRAAPDVPQPPPLDVDEEFYVKNDSGCWVKMVACRVSRISITYKKCSLDERVGDKLLTVPRDSYKKLWITAKDREDIQVDTPDFRTLEDGTPALEVGMRIEVLAFDGYNWKDAKVEKVSRSSFRYSSRNNVGGESLKFSDYRVKWRLINQNNQAVIPDLEPAPSPCAFAGQEESNPEALGETQGTPAPPSPPVSQASKRKQSAQPPSSKRPAETPAANTAVANAPEQVLNTISCVSAIEQHVQETYVNVCASIIKRSSDVEKEFYDNIFEKVKEDCRANGQGEQEAFYIYSRKVREEKFTPEDLCVRKLSGLKTALDEIIEATTELKRSMAAFDSELDMLKGYLSNKKHKAGPSSSSSA